MTSQSKIRYGFGQIIAFEELKFRLISAPILVYLNKKREEFVLDIYASAFAIVAVLPQKLNGKQRLIASGIKRLNEPQRNYCVLRREMLAVVYFTRYFKHYLLGKRVTPRTDHGSLTWPKNFKEPHGQIHRWMQQLSQFHMKILVLHRPGKGHADAMLRLTELPKEVCKQCDMSSN